MQRTLKKSLKNGCITNKRAKTRICSHKNSIRAMGGGHANSALSALDKHIACILGHTALGGDDQEADTGGMF